MRKHVTRLISVLLVLVMVFSVTITCYAAQDKPLLTLRGGVTATGTGGEVTIFVDATATGVVADGTLTFQYDSSKLRYVDTQAGTAWSKNADLSLKSNGAKAGVVVVAFAGVDAAKAGNILTLSFEAVGEGQSTVNLKLGDSYVTGADGYTLRAETTVTVGCPSDQFVDVDKDAYYHEGVDYVVGHGYMIGIDQTHFAPEMEMTRAMIVTVLYRMAGSPEVKGRMPFTDVKSGLWYYDAILWASQNKIAKGVTTTQFMPDQVMTREQMVTFLYRYAEYLELDTANEGSLDAFKDASQVSEYALDAMTWAVSNGIIRGMENDLLVPQGTSTRGQTATTIERFATTAQS